MLATNMTSVIKTIQDLTSQLGTSGAPSIACQFVYLTKTYVGTKTVLKREAVNTSAGLSTDYVFSVLCSVAQFGGVVPVSKQRVVIAAVTYKILEIETDAIGATYRLHLGSEYPNPK